VREEKWVEKSRNKMLTYDSELCGHGGVGVVAFLQAD